ncbi:hypothetical protein AVEN_254676-1 [Araneus ventricosus]|uniref:Uncharacterized protein n=1 Tax=Araneus ventricosus TaxID=182803 RepID=A0A4Y1ZJ72_ARAVE|nr:hypothetical protein AVEN_237499-1 [Araneus ventricosus]GBL53383.1 hypothetical protein AVEN_254676-1 [Araneus ventricosus]
MCGSLRGVHRGNRSDWICATWNGRELPAFNGWAEKWNGVECQLATCVEWSGHEWLALDASMRSGGWMHVWDLSVSFQNNDPERLRLDASMRPGGWRHTICTLNSMRNSSLVECCFPSSFIARVHGYPVHVYESLQFGYLPVEDVRQISCAPGSIRLRIYCGI